MTVGKTITADQMWTFEPATPSDRHRVVTLRVGPEGSPANTISRDLKRAAEKFLRVVADLRTSGFGTITRGEKSREASAGFITQIETAGKALARLRLELSGRMSRANFIAAWTPQTPYYEVQIDLRMLDRFVALPASQRAAESFLMRSEPYGRLQTIRALLRVPPELSGLSNAELTALRVAVFKTFERSQFEAMDTEVAMANVTLRMLRACAEVVKEAVGHSRDVAEHAPTAFSLLSDAELAWLPPGSENLIAPKEPQAEPQAA